ncbi:UNVERIFIED_CONTAM: hypothetical protein Scaly_2049000 [Sesamum calycinum]|uniref:DDE-1 domain-containing protein n=1 Tax=Sesamum calycinum TaxID=2727403 RepID=A0AAW2N1X2_9LAMI
MEKVLYEWFLQYQDRFNMTGELILEKAKHIMKLLYPQHPPEHQFSQGHGHEIGGYKGENKPIFMKDVFDLDETGLVYRLQADHSLATKQLEGRKTSKIQPCDAGIIRAFKMHYLSAWTINISQVSIANCFRHCKIHSNEEISSDSSETNFEESLHELENMIKDVGYQNEMDVNKLVDYPGENDECLMVQSLEEIVADIIEDPTNDEAEDDSIPLEPVTRKEALSATTTFHNFCCS